MYAVTGATGQLGRLAIKDLLQIVPAASLVALVRDPSKAADLGVDARRFDYDEPETLAPALAGIDRLLLISGSEAGKREPQHRAVIDAARTAGVSLIVYTSLLRADVSPMSLAVEHRATEALLAASGVPYVILRNGWYIENYAVDAPGAAEHGVVLGSAGDGRISAAARADYALAAAKVLTADPAPVGRIFELAGDEAFTLADYAAVLSEISGRAVTYEDLSQEDYLKALEGFGLPAGLAQVLSESDAKAAKGSLFDDGGELSGLIGRPTTPLRDVLKSVLDG